MSDPGRLLDQMASRSRRKLMEPRNVAKGTWLGMSDDQIIERIFDEVRELLTALREGSWDAIADEAADIYHFASMGADRERFR